MFWDVFSDLCEKNNIKPNPLAEKIGVSSGVVTKWKKGCVPSTDALLKIADYFDVSIDYLLGRPDDACTNVSTDGSNNNIQNGNNNNIAITNCDYDINEKKLIEKFRELDYEEQIKLMAEVIDRVKGKK